MTRDDRTPLATTRARVATWPGFRVTRSYRDESGAYAFAAVHDDRRYLCVVKRDLYAGLASFMRRVVERAVGEGYVLVEFVAAAYSDGRPTLDTAYAFDPHTVATEGERSEGASAKGVETSWIEIPADEYGATLGRYAFGDAELVPPGGRVAGQVRLGRSP